MIWDLASIGTCDWHWVCAGCESCYPPADTTNQTMKKSQAAVFAKFGAGSKPDDAEVAAAAAAKALEAAASKKSKKKQKPRKPNLKKMRGQLDALSTKRDALLSEPH